MSYDNKRGRTMAASHEGPTLEGRRPQSERRVRGFVRRSHTFAAVRGLLSCLALWAPTLTAQVETTMRRGTDETVPLWGVINPRARRDYDRGRVGSERRFTQITLTFRRSPEQQLALEQLLKDQQSPSSPQYHKWITPEEYGERFGVKQEEMDSVRGWLESQGFTVEAAARGRSWIVFSGAARQIETAFHTEFHRYEVGGRMHFALAAEPTIPGRFGRQIGSIRGLDDFTMEAPRRFRPLYTAGDGGHHLAPDDIATIYQFNSLFHSGIDGTGQSLVIIGQSGINLSDVKQFRSTFGLPENTPQTILVGEDPGLDRNGGMQEGIAGVEWAGAVARNANLIYVYAQNVLDAVQAAVDRNLAPVISFSFGTCEANLSSGEADAIRAIAQQANAQGITWISASGDAGAAACDAGAFPASHGLSVSFPASLPEVTGVGGTVFNESGQSYFWSDRNTATGASAGGYIPEKAWNDTKQTASLLASGGGASKLYRKPAWQSAPGVPANDARYMPDVSFAASSNHDAYLVAIDGLAYDFGGTSLAAPVLAGLVTLANQKLAAAAQGWSGLGNINPVLYAHVVANSWFPDSVSSDIIAGDNIVPCAEGTPDCVNGSLGYSAGPGYDLVTGLGSVFGLNWVFPIPTTTTLSPPANVVVEGQVPLTVTVTAGANVRLKTGTVQIFQGQGLVATGDLSEGVATFQIPFTPGKFTFTANYLGANYLNAPLFDRSISDPVTLLVTRNQPAPTLLFPADRADGIPVTVSLRWNGSRYATSYDVYLGTTSPPPLWGNTSSVLACQVTSLGSCTVNGLGVKTTYYWKIVARTPDGSVSSPVGSFTTTADTTYTISTLAGGGSSTGDGGLAIQAYLPRPYDVAIDRVGNVYIAEYDTNRVRMVTAAGIISTVAGSGSASTSGDGGPALLAGLPYPSGLAFDPQGSLYISSGNRIRKLTPDGTISTVAGHDDAGYAGDGGQAANAQLAGPRGLTTDSAGNLYFADSNNNCIRKIGGGTISTVVARCGVNSGSLGDGIPAIDARLIFPQGVAMDTAGNLYIAEQGNARIRKVSSGTITTLAGGGGAAFPSSPVPPLQAAFCGPNRVTVDAAGAVVFSDPSRGCGGSFGATRVYRIANGMLTPVAGNVTGDGISPGDGAAATAVYLKDPAGIATVSGGKIYFAETLNDRVRVLTPAGPPFTPSISPGGVLNAASYSGAPVAAGSIVSVYGNFGLESRLQPSSVPIPSALSGFAIQFGSAGIPAPLFYASPGQVNLQIPWELSGVSSASVSASLNGAGGPAQTLTLAPFSPGIFAMNGKGTGQGAIVDAAYRLVDSLTPTTAGSTIQIYCTGLGAVTNPPASGSPASTTTLSRTTTDPLVTIGGIEAQVLFSGLAPGSVGEYQVNVKVPASVAPGPAVPVMISMAGVRSNTVTIAIK